MGDHDDAFVHGFFQHGFERGGIERHHSQRSHVFGHQVFDHAQLLRGIGLAGAGLVRLDARVFGTVLFHAHFHAVEPVDAGDFDNGGNGRLFALGVQRGARAKHRQGGQCETGFAKHSDLLKITLP